MIQFELDDVQRGRIIVQSWRELKGGDNWEGSMLVSLAVVLITIILAAEPAIAGIACDDRGCRKVRPGCQILSGYGGRDRIRCNRPPNLQPTTGRPQQTPQPKSSR